MDSCELAPKDYQGYCQLRFRRPRPLTRREGHTFADGLNLVRSLSVTLDVLTDLDSILQLALENVDLEREPAVSTALIYCVASSSMGPDLVQEQNDVDALEVLGSTDVFEQEKRVFL